MGMVEMIRLADEPWAPVAQGHTGSEVVRSVRVALRGANGGGNRAAAKELRLQIPRHRRLRFTAWFAAWFACLVAIAERRQATVTAW